MRRIAEDADLTCSEFCELIGPVGDPCLRRPYVGQYAIGQYSDVRSRCREKGKRPSSATHNFAKPDGWSVGVFEPNRPIPFAAAQYN